MRKEGGNGLQVATNPNYSIKQIHTARTRFIIYNILSILLRAEALTAWLSSQVINRVFIKDQSHQAAAQKLAINVHENQEDSYFVIVSCNRALQFRGVDPGDEIFHMTAMLSEMKSN